MELQLSLLCCSLIWFWSTDGFFIQQIWESQITGSIHMYILYIYIFIYIYLDPPLKGCQIDGTHGNTIKVPPQGVDQLSQGLEGIDGCSTLCM